MNQSWLTKPSGAVPVAKPTLIFLPRSPNGNHWKSTVTFWFCSMKSLTRLWIQGRCCGFSKVQKVRLVGAVPCADARRERGMPMAAPRLAAPMPCTNLRRVDLRCLLLATTFIVISSNLACPAWTYLCSPTSPHLAAVGGGEDQGLDAPV